MTLESSSNGPTLREFFAFCKGKAEDDVAKRVETALHDPKSELSRLLSKIIDKYEQTTER